MKFSGELLDPSGLYDLRARQYDPQQSRFLQRDPLESPTFASYPSSYIYAFVDPSGARFTAYDDAVDQTRVATSAASYSSCEPPVRNGRIVCSGSVGANKKKFGDLGWRVEAGAWASVRGGLATRRYGHSWQVGCDERAEIEATIQVGEGRPTRGFGRGFVYVDAWSQLVQWVAHDTSNRY